MSQTTQPFGPANSPTLPLTYPDALCFDDIDPLGRETTSDLQTLVQDVYHSLIEDPGSNIDCNIAGVERGVGIYGLLSSSSTQPVQSIERRVATGILKDDRISTCTVKITAPTTPDGVYTIALTIGVGTAVLGLQFAFSATFGLKFNSWQVLS